MSFREIRAFTEKMRALGYKRVVSLESFRFPNFNLVADLLLWLVKSYDPNIDVPTDVSTEQDRIIFVKSIAQYMATKAHIKLNTRKLYGADGYAVKELLKIATVLYDATRLTYDLDDDDVSHQIPLDINSKLSMIKPARQLSSEITDRGANLYDLLDKERELRDNRFSAISRPIDLPVIEKAIRESIQSVQEQINMTKTAIENLGADESNLTAKIEKKKEELERREKRLKSLQGVRPAFMDEFEKIEQDLAIVYATYMERFRNMTYLEQQVDEYSQIEQEKMEETETSLKQMQSRIREEELRMLRGDFGDGSSGPDSDLGSDEFDFSTTKESLRDGRGRSLHSMAGDCDLEDDNLDDNLDDEDETHTRNLNFQLGRITAGDFAGDDDEFDIEIGDDDGDDLGDYDDDDDDNDEDDHNNQKVGYDIDRIGSGGGGRLQHKFDDDDESRQGGDSDNDF